jgi:hypothetical protein
LEGGARSERKDFFDERGVDPGFVPSLGGGFRVQGLGFRV